MKKILLPFLLVCVCICLVVVFAIKGCKDDTVPHEHEISVEWSFDDYYHYHEASCLSTNHRTDVALHEGDTCFCGYVKKELQGPTNDNGDDSFTNFALTKKGTLSFNKIKNSSKYVLTITPTGSSTPISVDVNMSETDIKLDTLFKNGFPTGKTTVQFQAWGYDTVEIDGEKITEEVPMPGVKEIVRIVKLNGQFELQSLTYVDDYVKLDGFYSQEKQEVVEYIYELNLSNNKPTAFNIAKYITAVDGVMTKVYKTADARNNNDSDKAYGEFDFSTISIKHGNNYFYLRAVDLNGTVKDYDLCVCGLYNVEISRYLVTTTATDSFGVRSYSEQKIGDKFTVAERDIITYETLYNNVAEGLIARDDKYNLISRGDYMLSTANSPQLSLYFYDEETVITDCAEFANYSKKYGASVFGNNISMSIFSDYTDEELYIPYVIAGKAISSVSVFYNDSIKKISIAEGFKYFPISVTNCTKIADIYLPSTIEQLSAFTFKNIPTTATLHCAFSSVYAERFDWKWNQINGSMNKYKTLYDEVLSTPPSNVNSDGLLYELINGELMVAGNNDAFRGKIPDTAEFNGSVYPVTAVKLLNDCSNLVVKIGKNVKTIEGEAFMSQVKGIELDADNKNFIFDKGCLYNAEKTRLIVTCHSQDFLFLPSTLTIIDYYALYSNAKNVDYITTIFYDMTQESVKSMIGRTDGNIRNDFRHYEVKISAVDYFYDSHYYANDGVEYIIFGEFACPTHRGDIFCEYRDRVHAIALRVIKSDENLDISIADGAPVLGYYFGKYSKFTIPNNVKKLTVNSGLYTLNRNCYSESKIEEITLIDDYTLNVYHMPASSDYLKVYSVKDSTKYATECGILYDASKTMILSIPLQLEGDIIIPEGVETVSGFENRKKVTSIKLPSTIKSVGQDAFKGCSSLKLVEFSGTDMVNIGVGAFTACTLLEKIYLPKIEVDYYGGYELFKYCGSLKTIIFNGSIEEFYEHFHYDKDYDSFDDAWLMHSYVITIKCIDGEIEIEDTI